MNLSLTIMTTATGEMLATLEDVKDALDITDGQYDETLKRFITRASGRIETYLGRTLGVQTYRAVVPGYGRRRLMLPAYPVRAVLRAFDGTDTGTAGSLESSSYKLDKEAGMLSRDEGFAWDYTVKPDVISYPEPGQEVPTWMVEFGAGYILPAGRDSGSTGDGTTNTGPTLPQDIQDACISLVRSMWHGRKREPNVTSKRVGDIAITYSEQSGTLPNSIMATLSPYRSII